MVNYIEATDRGWSKLYIFSKDNILKIDVYPSAYVWLLFIIVFVVVLFLGIVLFLVGLIIDWYFSSWIFKKSVGENEIKKIETNSLAQLKTKTIDSIEWKDITKAQVKNQYLDLYKGDRRIGVIIKGDREELLKLLKLKLKDNLKING